ncbi:MAG: hypothetical protein ACO21B_11830, partial [Gemmobacter sp.]
DVLSLGIDRTQTGYYFAGATAVMHEETILQAQSEAHALEQEARLILARSGLSWGVEAMVAQSASVSGLVARRSRYADLVILPKPYGKDQYADAPVIPEAAMFHGNVPVIILAQGTDLSATPTRVVIAWNDSPEAMIALRRAGRAADRLGEDDLADRLAMLASETATSAAPAPRDPGTRP